MARRQQTIAAIVRVRVRVRVTNSFVTRGASKRALLDGAPCLGCVSCLHVQVLESVVTENGFFFTVIDSEEHRLEFCVRLEEERREWCERIRERARWVAETLDSPEEPCALGSDYRLDGDYDVMDPEDDKKHILGQHKHKSQVSLRFKYVPCKVLANEYETESEGEEDEGAEEEEEDRGVI